MRHALALLIAASLTAVLGGCAVYTPSGAIVIDPARGAPPAGGPGGGFCPPGQAKKGNC